MLPVYFLVRSEHLAIMKPSLFLLHPRPGGMLSHVDRFMIKTQPVALNISSPLRCFFIRALFSAITKGLSGRKQRFWRWRFLTFSLQLSAKYRQLQKCRLESRGRFIAKLVISWRAVRSKKIPILSFFRTRRKTGRTGRKRVDLGRRSDYYSWSHLRQAALQGSCEGVQIPSWQGKWTFCNSFQRLIKIYSNSPLRF